VWCAADKAGAVGACGGVGDVAVVVVVDVVVGAVADAADGSVDWRCAHAPPSSSAAVAHDINSELRSIPSPLPFRPMRADSARRGRALYPSSRIPSDSSEHFRQHAVVVELSGER
jgi:hypothetical protein